MRERTAGAYAALPPSRTLLSFFHWYLRWFVGRHFHGLRLANGIRFPQAGGPLIVYSNHASWWDPLAFILMSRHFLPEANHYAPMESRALKHYGFLRRLGIFPVETTTQRGAAQFLQDVKKILSTPKAVLWLTPEGRFSDVRTRPLVFRAGLATIVSRIGPCTVVPLAAEYTFWDERLPEMLFSCGQPIFVDENQCLPVTVWNDRLQEALAATQDELASLSQLRDPSRFETLLSGKVGISGVYEGWKRLVALMTGRAYQGSHGSIHRS
jgi:1-acyl-sn-glycerol-3-phosphate acyltransferase